MLVEILDFLFFQGTIVPDLVYLDTYNDAVAISKYIQIYIYKLQNGYVMANVER
jgi:hypothetical protein